MSDRSITVSFHFNLFSLSWKIGQHCGIGFFLSLYLRHSSSLIPDINIFFSNRIRFTTKYQQTSPQPFVFVVIEIGEHWNTVFFFNTLSWAIRNHRFRTSLNSPNRIRFMTNHNESSRRSTIHVSMANWPTLLHFSFLFEPSWDIRVHWF